MGFVRAAESRLLRKDLPLLVAKPADKPTVWIGAGDRPFVLDEQETALWTFRTGYLVFTGTHGLNLIANPDGLEMSDSVRQANPLIDR